MDQILLNPRFKRLPGSVQTNIRDGHISVHEAQGILDMVNAMDNNPADSNDILDDPSYDMLTNKIARSTPAGCIDVNNEAPPTYTIGFNGPELTNETHVGQMPVCVVNEDRIYVNTADDLAGISTSIAGMIKNNNDIYNKQFLCLLVGSCALLANYILFISLY